VPRGADCQSDYQSAPYIHASVFPGARGAPRRLRGDRVSSPARRGAQPLPTRRRSRRRPARAPGIAHAMDLAAFPLAAGAPHRACPAAALGRAGLEVGPHEHLAGRTSHRRGDLRDDRTRPEQGEHRGGQPPSCSERYSHAHSSLSARTQGRGHSSLRLYKSTGQVKVQCVCRGGLRPVATSGRGIKPASGTHFARKVPRRSSAACIRYTSPVRFTGSAEHAGVRRRCASARPLEGLSAPARPPAPASSGTPGTARWPACAPSCGT